MHRGLQAACPDGLGAAVDTRSLHRIREIGKVLGLKNYKTDLNYKTDKLHWAQEIPQAEEKKKKRKRKSEAWVCVCGRYYTHLPCSSSAG